MNLKQNHRLFMPIAALAGTLAGAAIMAGCNHFFETIAGSSDFARLASLRSDEYAAAAWTVDRDDAAGRLYTAPATREKTMAFFSAVAGDRAVAEAILAASAAYGVPPTLSFALAYEESRYDPKAVNRNVGSVDRGLFQLNSKSFPTLTLENYYDPAASARYGLAHLSYCLELGGNEVAALAMYNAGTSRVDAGGTPRRTLDYVFRITSYRDNLDLLFDAQIASHFDERRVGNGIVLDMPSVDKTAGAKARTIAD